jgi:dTDP-4-dehydrorhamnose 3,5-epimerase
MSDNTIVHYYMGDSFNPDTYSGIRYNDPMFSINWPCEPAVISDKDLNIPDYLGK